MYFGVFFDIKEHWFDIPIDLTLHILADQALTGSKSDITKSYSDTSYFISFNNLINLDDEIDFIQSIDPNLL